MKKNKILIHFSIVIAILFSILFQSHDSYAHFEKEKENYKQSLNIAHKIALWTRCDPKKFPMLEDIFKEIDDAQEKAVCIEQTPDKMLDVVKALHMKFGGE